MNDKKGGVVEVGLSHFFNGGEKYEEGTEVYEQPAMRQRRNGRG